METRRRRPRGAVYLRVVNIWVIVGALMVACFLSLATLGILTVTRPSTGPDAPATAVIHVQFAPTPTLPAPTLPPVTPTSSPPPLPESGEISVGAYAQIQGTGGDGLRLRDKPGLDGKVLLLGSEAEVFQVADGPVEVDGYTWWYLVGPFDNTRLGWAVSNYLVVVQNP